MSGGVSVFCLHDTVYGNASEFDKTTLHIIRCWVPAILKRTYILQDTLSKRKFGYTNEGLVGWLVVCIEDLRRFSWITKGTL